ncbi:MAG: PDZ domain-containing protein [Lentisphaeria bacterium]|nr:PDZ domain-containing protein [Lentisphaeria bacterium]
MDMDFYISQSGDDLNPGTFDQPFKSVGRARAEVCDCGERGERPITVHLRAGAYYLDDTLRFTAEDSGSPEAPVTYAAYQGEAVVISGGTRLAFDWAPYRDGILQAKTPPGLDIDQLFVNGKRQHMARYPNYDPAVRPLNGFAAAAFSPERAARWRDPAGGYIHAMHSKHWGGYHYRITGKNADGTVAYEGGWQNNRQMGMHDEHRFVENIFEELDAPGEWFHRSAGSRQAGILYYYPPEDVDVDTAIFEIARLKHLVEFNGVPESPARHIRLQGLTFRHAARTIMEPYEPLLRSDWSIYRGGAVLFAGAEDCDIADCEFDQVGGNAVFVSGYNRRIVVRGTHIHGTGGNGVCFVGSPDSVRSPLFERFEHQAYRDLDLGAGPKTDNYPADCVVEDCLIHDIGVVEKQVSGVQISMSSGITVRHCSIYDICRAGINISEGTFGGHLIEFCDVFDTVLETDDHGSFNSWGRDRYWELEGEQPEDLDLAEIMLLDAEKTIIRDSRWRCDHGWDVDLDDGSSNYEITNNLFLRGGLKLREGFYRRVYNNMAINSTLHPHVWYPDSRDVVTHNLWMAPYRPVLKNWGGEIDRNLFVSEFDRQAFADKGCDANSIVGDPIFADPANGDYRLGEDSPLLGHGFENFPMDQFGVKKPALKAIARTPDFPDPILDAERPEGRAATAIWMGAEVAALTGEQFSAFGIKREDGGIHLVTVPPDSAAAKAGLMEHDLIQRVNGCPTRTVKDLRQTISNAAGDTLRIRLIRNIKTELVEIAVAKCEGDAPPNGLGSPFYG